MFQYLKLGSNTPGWADYIARHSRIEAPQANTHAQA
jgi:hypothetical protein